jgi:thermitase
MKAKKTPGHARATAIAAALACAFGAFTLQAWAQSSQPNLHKPGEIRFAENRLLVQPRVGLSVQEFDKKLKAHGARRVREIPNINVHVVELPRMANERAVAQMLRSDRHIKFAEVDELLAPSGTPNDPQLGSAWHLPAIAAPQAWDRSVGAGVTIAILDSGVDPSHPDLAGSLVPGYNIVNGNSDTRDVFGHGTKVAGAAAMIGNNLVGGTGVAYNARIMPVRVAESDGSAYVSAMANGIIWAADNGARVANLSFRNVCLHSTILSAAQYMRGKGGVVTGSAGNTGVAESIPASDAITCVAAIDSADNKASFSSYGTYVDVAAPGVGIYTTTNGGGYGSVSGTSFSAPVTAGVYALMMAANPSLSPSQLDNALFSTASDLGAAGKDPYFGYGRVNAAAAVGTTGADTGDGTAPSVSISAPVAGTKVRGLVPVDVRASDDVGLSRVEFYADGTLVGSDTLTPYGFSWDSTGSADGEVILEARAVDSSGNVATTQVTVLVGNDTSAPQVMISNPRSGEVISNAVTVTANATDNNRVAKMTLLINGKQVATSEGDSVSFDWDPYAGGATKGKGGGFFKRGTSYIISATSTDDAGNIGTTSMAVSVK